MSVAASSPFNYVQSVVRKAHREFSEASTMEIRTAAAAWKKKLEQAACLTPSAINRRDILLDDIENLVIRCQLADAKRPVVAEPVPPSQYLRIENLGTRYELVAPFTTADVEVLKKNESSGVLSPLEPQFDFSDHPSVWFPYPDVGIRSYHFFKLGEKNVNSLVLSDTHKKMLEERRDALVREAEAFFQEKGEIPEIECTFTQEALNSDQRLIEEILLEKNFDGFFIGERHGDKGPLKFLLDNLVHLHKAGVRTIFVEKGSYDSLQKHLDAYFASPSDEMHPVLKASFIVNDFLRGFGQYHLMNLIKKAKELGIRIVIMDTTLANECGDGDESRALAMNYAAFKIIQHEKGSGKYVGWSGAMHGATTQYSDGRVRLIPGLADLCRSPLLVFLDDDTGPRIETGVKSRPYLSMHVLAELNLSSLREMAAKDLLEPELAAAIRQWDSTMRTVHLFRRFRTGEL